MRAAIGAKLAGDGVRTRYAYVLSDKGKELGLMILALMQWGDKHLKDGVAAIDVAIKPRIVSGEPH